MTNWDSYSAQPNFSAGDANRVRRMKKALGNDHSHRFKERIRGKLNDLYKKRGRARNTYNKTALYGEGTYTGGQMDQQVIAGVRGKYGQAFSDYEKQIAGSPQRQAQISKYYQDYQAELGNIRTQQAQQAQQMIDAQQSNTQKTQAAEGAANAQAGQALSADAASRGQSIDPSLIAKANQSSAARATTGNSQSAALMAAKNSYDNFYAQQGLISKGANQADIAKEGKYTQTLRDKLLGLQKEAGDFATTLRGSLDESQFQRGMSQQALGLKKGELAVRQQNANTSAYNATHKGSGKGGGGKGGDGGLTSTQIRGYKSKYLSLKSQTKAALTTIDPKTGKPYLTGGGAPAQQYINYLVSNGADPRLAEAAVLSALRAAGKSKRRDKNLAREIHKEFGFWPGI